MAHRYSEPPADPGRTVSQSDDGRLNPKTLDLAKPKRTRRRKLPSPPAEVEVWGKAAEKRARARPYPPGVILEPAGMDAEHMTAPHGDTGLWSLQLGEAFGTRSRAVLETFMQQLKALCGQSHWDEEAKRWRIDEHEFSALLAIINAAKPRNEIEAMLVAQMAAIHLLQMKVTARAIKYDDDTRTAETAAKLAKAFALQFQTLREAKGRRRTVRQQIKVSRETHHHQHVHVHRGEGVSDAQAHEPRPGEPPESQALQGTEPGGQVLRLPGRSRA